MLLAKIRTATVRITALFKGFIILNLILLPLSLFLVLFIGIMAGGSPNSGDALTSFATVLGFIYVAPFGALLWHVVVAKIVDTVFFIVPPLKMQVSWFGIAAAALLLVIAGNIFVDDLYQFRRGNFSLSLYALVFDIGGMALVAFTGGIRLRFLDRFLGRSAPAPSPPNPAP